jgi:8-demethyl-8-alpha-L-rhamnosyltetracenomycin-C 2'-O-methyltransferase
MWDAYFTHPETRIYSIDCNDTYFSALALCSARCTVHKADQENPGELCAFVAATQQTFDIIIDDGGHSMNQQITSFKTLFPFLKPGGLYIIEDLHTSYWQEYGSLGSQEEPMASANSTIRFLQALVDDINFVGARTSCANKEKHSLAVNLNEYQKNIKAIHFYSSTCIIEKL